MRFASIDYDHGDDLKLTWMYLNVGGASYTQCGIGRRMIELMHEYHCGPLIAGKDEGTTDEDGSHLTRDGPGFVRMRGLGLIM